MDAGDYTTTRRHLHGVAEAVIAGPQYRRSGVIRLTVRDDGFGGVVLPVAVAGTDLVWSDGRTPLTGTLRELGAAAGLEAGAPADLYSDGSGVDLDEPLRIGVPSAKEIASWFALGDAALREFAPGAEPVLWPEHFDLAVVVEGITVGVSPGDSFHPAPYAYVSPGAALDGEFWNAPFGALRELADVGTRMGLVAFFTEGVATAAKG